jgi:non-ribosomal peptide synthetase component E (peptide arylation enzyme)
MEHMMIEASKRPPQNLVDEYMLQGWWGKNTFADIVERRARLHPDRIAFVDAHRGLSYGELWSQVRRFAEFLRRRGIRAGDVVTLQLPNRVEFPIVFFALELVGAIANKISSDLRAVEVDYILRFSKSAAYVCARSFRDFDFVEMIGGIRDGLPDLKEVICIDTIDEPRVSSFASVMADTPEIADADRVRMDADDVMRMCFTSGTTGNPKGVLHSFNTTLCAARFLNEDMRVTEGDVFLIYLPVGLNWGYLTLLQTVMAGAKGVLLERFSTKAALQLIAREQVTYIPTAPASIVAMLSDPGIADQDLSSLRVVITGGASAPIEAIKAFQARLPNAKLIELYGMLETGFHAYTRLDDDPVQVNGTIGRCIRQLSLQILDDHGLPVPHGAQGELAAKGPSVHLGYLNNDAANRDSFTADGWFLTGDLGEFVDDAGNVRISGRKKEIINRGGKKYFPREIEEILYEHPAFLQVAIVGMPDARLGERNCLCAVLKPGQTVTLPEVVALLKGRVADYKLPEQLEILPELPMTPSGKVRRPELLKQLQQAGG